MIELTKVKINEYDSIISTRNKAYRLALDLNMGLITATRLATVISELLNTVFKQQKSVQVLFGFTKESGFYYLLILISCTEQIYSTIKNSRIFSVAWSEAEDNQSSGLALKLIIKNPDFIPNNEFLVKERESLIQQSISEMVHEIHRKNIELTKALQDVSNSSHMIQTEKMRALGVMTAGVAHELNNPMMGIMNFVQYAIKHTDKDNRIYSPLADAEREIKRCQEIVTNLLTFSSSKSIESKTNARLSVLFDRVLQIQGYKLRELCITVTKTFPVDEPEVEIKSNHIQQVIFNLINNAIDAMKNSEIRELSLSISFQNNVLIKVSDTGIGINEEALDTIYEPFFTTKDPGQGTGLGLAVTKSIIEKHQGRISCQSIVGKGTTFTVTLPVS